MHNYTAEPVYRPQVFMQRDVDALNGVTHGQVEQGRGFIRLKFLKDDETEAFSLTIPSATDNKEEAGVMGGDLLQDVLDALKRLGDHIGDTTIHVSDEDRNKLGGDGTITDLTVAFSEDLTVDPSTRVMNSGETLSDLMSDVYFLIYNHIKDASDVKKKHHFTREEILDLIDQALDGLDDFAPKDHDHVCEDITDFKPEVEKIVGEQQGLDIETVKGWNCLTLPGGYAICTKTFELDLAIEQKVESTYYEYCTPRLMLGNDDLPFEFDSLPQLYLGVQHKDATILNGIQGVGVWAVAVGMGTTSKLPNLRLQCASTVSKRKYMLCVRVEGFKKKVS